jgi:hypothetical protein
MSVLTIAHKFRLFAAATAVSTAGFLTIAMPAQAGPMVPLAPTCATYLWPGGGVFTAAAGNGTTTHISTSQDYVVGRASSLADGAPVADASYGNPSGGITGGSAIDITVAWDQGPDAGYVSHFTGNINDDGLASGILALGNRQDAWSSSQKFSCITSAPPAPPPPAPVARLGVSANGPTTLAAGMSGTYTVSLSNSGDVSAPVELYVSFGGQLQLAGQAGASSGFDCTVQDYAGGTSSVHCTTAQLQSKATATITVQGRGSSPGAGHVNANINSADPGAQFVQKSQQVNVSIT